MMLRNLTWFLGAFGATLTILAFLRYRLSVYEKRMDLKNSLQEISQEVALGYFQHCYGKLCELPASGPYKAEIAALKAQCLLGLGRRDELLEFLERTLEHHAQNHTARRMYAKLLVESGDPMGALAQFRLLEGKLLEEDLLEHATALYQIHDYIGCQNLIEEQCKKPSGQILSLLADALYKQKEWLLAIDYYQKAENLGWRPLSLIAHKAECLCNASKFQEAENGLREWLRAQPRNTQAAALLAHSLESQNKIEGALQIIEAFEEDLAQNPLANATLGRCFFKLKEYSKAIHYLLNAYELGHDNPSSMALAGISLEKQQLWSHAEKLYGELINEYPDNFSGYAGIAYLFAIGQSKELGPQRGLEYALRAVELAPSMAAWEILSAAYARCSMFEKAHQIQQSLMAYAKDDSSIARREDAMRRLKQQKILANHLVSRIEVA